MITDSGVEAKFFRTHVNQTIYTAMRELIREGRSVDYITLLAVREPKDIGGANYLFDLKRFANAVRFDEYEELIIDSWKEREKVRLLHHAIQESWSLIDILQTFDHLQDLKTDDLAEQYEKPYERTETAKGILTGLPDLDKILDGFQDSEYIVVAARPSMGKADVITTSHCRQVGAGICRSSSRLK